MCHSQTCKCQQPDTNQPRRFADFIPGKYYKTREGQKLRYIGRNDDRRDDYKLVFALPDGRMQVRTLEGKWSTHRDLDIVEEWKEPEVIKYRLYLVKAADYSTRVLSANPAYYEKAPRYPDFQYWIGEEQTFTSA